MDFLKHTGPELRDNYLDLKSQGYTGCIIVTDDAIRRLSLVAKGCAQTATTGDGTHTYARVAVEARDYWIDFTADQFLAYPEILARHRSFRSERRSDDSKPSYAGTVIMPYV
jgi:hypothetical protein